MMAMLDSVDESDGTETVISVHSPVMFTSKSGSVYTTYAISLKSNNPCFSQPFSCVRRRYSEFVHLRNILKSHHVNIEPPPLPPKVIFNRFSQSFINVRTEGLQNFLRSLLDVPVYLSSKAVHLFLQSHCTMAEIDKQVCGDVPPPRLIDFNNPQPIRHSDSSSSLPDQGFANCRNLVGRQFSASFPPLTQQENPISCTCSEDSISSEEQVSPLAKSAPIPILPAYLRENHIEKIGSISEIKGELSPSSSSSSSFSSTDSMNRHVSFCDEVKVAVVRNELWNIRVRPIKAGAS